MEQQDRTADLDPSADIKQQNQQQHGENIFERIINDPDRLRFHLELEFLQCLANPKYIHFLAQQGYFDNPAFVNYLEYLKYWQQPQYARFVVYPHALYFLDLLQSDIFRNMMKKEPEMNWLHERQINHWIYNKRKPPQRPEAQPSSSDKGSDLQQV
ncbi:suppressor of hpr1 [Spiromyces aspiralis]|uniref:Suppressor of hpr1 n=1 Tax=Spiromyces aspiralis TaxID=68401 RepID=A0ACC1HCP0_9FUNG|nr:suppressor of hpr1 [Spiromyces aspiralis]